MIQDFIKNVIPISFSQSDSTHMESGVPISTSSDSNAGVAQRQSEKLGNAHLSTYSINLGN